MRYIVYIRRIVENWEDNHDEWSDEYYSEPYIEAESKEDAISIAKEFVTDCGYDPENYDWIAKAYEE